MSNFELSLIDFLQSVYNSTYKAVRLSMNVKDAEMACHETKIIDVNGNAVEVFCGGPTNNHWYNFRMM